MTSGTKTNSAAVKLPLDRPAIDAPDDVLRQHFMTVRDVFATRAFDITQDLCYTCCASGENVQNKGRSGRMRSCSDECEALFHRMYPATTASLVKAAADVGDEEEEETDDMAKAKGKKATKGARKRKAAPTRVEPSRPAKAAAKPRAAKVAGEKIDPATLKPGMKLTARHKGTDYHASVVANGDGVGIRFDGETFKSLSAAGSKITGGAVNGRAFWSVA